jgi:HTH-type transcriptional regulator / antitoxin HipB
MQINDTAPRIAVRDSRSFGAALATFRKRRGVDQDELAMELGTYRPTISRVENGHAVAQLELIFQMIRALDVEIHIVDRVCTDGSF